jgi:hypothetical protein
MNLLEKLYKISKSKAKIIEGLKNKIFKKEEVEEVAKERLEICRSNQCGFYDEKGISEMAVIPGIESCGACGCSLSLKTRCLSCRCGLEDVEGRIPLWENIISQEEEDELEKI